MLSVSFFYPAGVKSRRFYLNLQSVKMGASESQVMQKIGMKLMGFFSHPALPDGHRLKPHVLYKLELCHTYPSKAED